MRVWEVIDMDANKLFDSVGYRSCYRMLYLIQSLGISSVQTTLFMGNKRRIDIELTYHYIKRMSRKQQMKESR